MHDFAVWIVTCIEDNFVGVQPGRFACLACLRFNVVHHGGPLKS
jgi:hypothetical protein